MIIIFTDGSSRGNPGPGGWGAIVIHNKKVLELGGGKKKTTNNRMEMAAAIGVLSHTSKEAEITLYTDSSYLINGITKWVKGWKRNGWLTRAREEVLNKDLWMEIDTLARERTIDWNYVSGHAGISGNERCDEIATGFADGKKVKLFRGDLSDYKIPNILNIKKSEFKAKTKSCKKTKAYSYVSSIGGIIKVHHSWEECERRVKGTKGARYKKSLDTNDEERIIEKFGEF